VTPEELEDLAERVAALDRLDSAMAAALQPDRTRQGAGTQEQDLGGRHTEPPTDAESQEP
jgi:hypothetical protein